MLGKDLKKLFNEIPDNARIIVKIKGYGCFRDAEERDFNFKFSEENCTLIDDERLNEIDAYRKRIINSEGEINKPQECKILDKFKAVVLKKSVKP